MHYYLHIHVGVEKTVISDWSKPNCTHTSQTLLSIKFQCLGITKTMQTALENSTETVFESFLLVVINVSNLARTFAVLTDRVGSVQ